MGLGGEHDLSGLRVTLGSQGGTTLRSHFRPPGEGAGTGLTPWAICPPPYRTFASSLQNCGLLSLVSKTETDFHNG